MTDINRVSGLAMVDDAPARQWWPAGMADEVMPPGKASPDDFLFEHAGEIVLGYRPDDEHVSEGEREVLNRVLSEGEIVPFLCCDDLGEVGVTVEADGTFTVDGAISPRATHFMAPGDVDSLSSSIEEFAKNCGEWARSTGEPFPYRETCRLAWWSDEIAHKLVRGSKFEMVSAAQARQ